MIELSLLQADYIRDNTKDVVLNTISNLIWQDDANVSTITKNWIDAIDYCEESTLGGFNDWRLPNFNELYLLADRSIYNPGISPIFTNVVNANYWSSTTYKTNTYAWIVDFYNGYDSASSKILTYYVRCVR